MFRPRSKNHNIPGLEILIKSSAAVSCLFPDHSLNIQQPLQKFIVGDVQAQIQKSLSIPGFEILIKNRIAVSRLFPGRCTILPNLAMFVDFATNQKTAKLKQNCYKSSKPGQVSTWYQVK